MGFGFPKKQFSFYQLFLFVVVLLITSVVLAESAATDNTTLVYCCAEQALSDPNAEQDLSALFGFLVTQSTKTNFILTNTRTAQSSITGLFQCREDLSTSDCYNCVSQLPQMSYSLCGKSIASSIHLYGCYILYEMEDSAQISGMKTVYKTCTSTNVAGRGFEERRDTASSGKARRVQNRNHLEKLGVFSLICKKLFIY